MSRLAGIRENLNLTQHELAKRSGISIRTIQRIEAGTTPKGYTLKILLETLKISKGELLGLTEPSAAEHKKTLRLINLSSLSFFIPFMNILLPLLLIRQKKENSSIAKHLVNLQLLWTVSVIIIVGISPFLVRWIGASRQLTLQLLLVFFLLNLFLILRNAVALENTGQLYFKLNFSIL